jgi:protocatechuate 3,4-dioxygenase beta subunit
MTSQQPFDSAASGSEPSLSRRRLLRAGLAVPPLFPLAACGTPAATPTAAPTSRLSSATIGVAAASPSAAAATAGCVLTPEQTEGPYYIDVALMRSDVTEGKAGVPLQLDLTVQRAGTCTAIQNATVEIWHCDALGVYSGYDSNTVQAQGEPSNSGGGSPRPGGPGAGVSPKPGGPPSGVAPGGGMPGSDAGHVSPTNTATFLRGGQASDASGKVTFQTVYPGWYQGRTVHIHVKVHAGGQVAHTGQLYFDEAVTSAVYTQAPYATHAGRDTTNASDGIYRDGGAQSMLALSPSGSGYLGTMTLVVQA